MAFKPLPVGVDNFEKLIRGGYYYVDKTWMIKELLDMKGEVNLFTRPRRFGKTLSVSMLQYFFEDTGSEVQNQKNRELFSRLNIMKAEEYCRNEMNQYPVISLSLKSAKQPDYELAYACLKEEIGREFVRHAYVRDGLITEESLRRYEDIMNLRGDKKDFITALRFLSDCLYEYNGKNTILLIDEYDVPLENSWFAGFYEEMVDFLRSLFESALKTNPHLEFAVLTGCLRISKESIFTGLNNLEIHSILSEAYAEHFGFLQSEVDEMLKFYDRSEARDTVRAWYDGYRFGAAEVYNPWSVINYVKALYMNPNAFPAPYWKNTSSNAIVRDLVEHADPFVKREIEQLIAGQSIEKPIHEDTTYEDIYESGDNLWNFLFFTGYLKKGSDRMEGRTRFITMTVPNEEVAYIYESTIANWFRDKIKMKDLSMLHSCLMEGEAQGVQRELSGLLIESISYLDGREAFYHGFLLGILKNMKEYLVTSNRESGYGRYDIAVRSLDVSKTPVIIELKISDTFKGLEEACERALTQIEDKHYDDWLPEEGYTEVWNYGIAFFKKQCAVKAEKKQFKS